MKSLILCKCAWYSFRFLIMYRFGITVFGNGVRVLWYFEICDSCIFTGLVALLLSASFCSAWRRTRLGVIMLPGLLFVNLVTPWRVLKCLSSSSVLVDFNEMILLCLAAWTVMECQYLPYKFLAVRELGFPITSFKIIACKKAWLWRRSTNFGGRKFAGKYKSLLSSGRESSNVWILGLTSPRTRNMHYTVFI